MANYYGTPAIVTDGLVFAVDAGNGQSYVSASLNTFSLVSSETGSLKNDIGFSSNNQGAWDFDGADDYILCGSPSTGIDTHTISMWINPTSITNDDRIISNFDNTNFSVRFYSGQLQVWGNSWQNIFLSPSVSVWTHIAFAFNGDIPATITGYKNGETENTMATVYNLSQLGIGARAGNAYGDEFHGKIADCQVYNRALTAAEVLQNYNATKNRFI